MLVLSRRVEEAVQIGDAITITVTAIRGGRVLLGVDAPLDTSILRQETYAKVVAERDSIQASRNERDDEHDDVVTFF